MNSHIRSYRKTVAGGTFRGVARAAFRFEKLGRDLNRGKVLTRLPQQDRVGLMQAIDGRSFRSVDLGPFVAEAVAVIALGQRGPFPYAGRACGELADQARPVVDIRGRARPAVDGAVASSKSGNRTADPRIGPSRSIAKSIR